MTCSQAAQLIHRFCEHRPSSKDGRALKAHLGVCKKCKDFIEQFGKRFRLGDVDVSCEEIPNDHCYCHYEISQKSLHKGKPWIKG